jgi:hypothetical protein
MRQDITEVRLQAHCSDDKFEELVNRTMVQFKVPTRFNVIYEDDRVYVEAITVTAS